jgi:hypothetical protein
MGQNPDFYVTPSSGLFELLYNSRKVYTEAPEFKAEDSKFNIMCIHLYFTF